MTMLKTFLRCHCNQILKTEEELAAHKDCKPFAPDPEIENDEVIDDKNHCPTCGARTVEYTHTLTKGLVSGLKRVIASVHAAGRNDVAFSDIDFGEFNRQRNFQKLRYFGLVAHVRDAAGNPIRGRWLITRRGGAFLRGEIEIPHQVTTYRNRIVKRSDVTVSVKEVAADHDTAYYQKEFAPKPHIQEPDYQDL